MNAFAEYFRCDKSQIEYGKWYVKGRKKGWIFEKEQKTSN